MLFLAWSPAAAFHSVAPGIYSRVCSHGFTFFQPKALDAHCRLMKRLVCADMVQSDVLGGAPSSASVLSVALQVQNSWRVARRGVLAVRRISLPAGISKDSSTDYLATTSHDGGSIRLWQIPMASTAALQEVASYDMHKMPICALVASPCGRLLSGSFDRSALMLRINRPLALHPIAELSEHPGWVRAGSLFHTGNDGLFATSVG